MNEVLDKLSEYLKAKTGIASDVDRVLIEMVRRDGTVFWEAALYYIEDGAYKKYVPEDSNEILDYISLEA